jgi:ABC-type transport system involved in cytochrome c biogenesis permease subunit
MERPTTALELLTIASAAGLAWLCSHDPWTTAVAALLVAAGLATINGYVVAANQAIEQKRLVLDRQLTRWRC